MGSGKVERTEKFEFMKKNNIKRGGFTLIEILVVIGIIAVLAAIVLVAINPARQFAQARNTQRTSNVETILNGLGQYLADNKGVLPAAVSGLTVDTPTEIKKTGGVDICAILVTTYMTSLPSDPTAANGGAAISDCASAYETDYTVARDANNRLTVSAPNATAASELSQTISITR
ncbi:MAG: type II secretion system protein [bacterium]|nr:type II secretion system protein [bacterium]